MLAEIGGEVAGAFAVYASPILPEFESQKNDLNLSELADVLQQVSSTPFTPLNG